MAKNDGKTLSAVMIAALNLTPEQVAAMLKQGFRMAATPGFKVVDYTTKAGKRGLYLSDPKLGFRGTFLSLADAEKALLTLGDAVKRAKAGEVDEVRQAQGVTTEE
jgi:hypothetical protein